MLSPSVRGGGATLQDCPLGRNFEHTQSPNYNLFDFQRKSYSVD